MVKARSQCAHMKRDLATWARKCCKYSARSVNSSVQCVHTNELLATDAVFFTDDFAPADAAFSTDDITPTLSLLTTSTAAVFTARGWSVR